MYCGFGVWLVDFGVLRLCRVVGCGFPIVVGLVCCLVWVDSVVFLSFVYMCSVWGRCFAVGVLGLWFTL